MMSTLDMLFSVQKDRVIVPVKPNDVRASTTSDGGLTRILQVL